MPYNPLNKKEADVLLHQATEMPFSGEYDDFYQKGTFICRQCNNPLFSSQSKFDAGCGWPSFDENFPHALKRVPDFLGFSTEIRCANCGGHLGHVFTGEKFTPHDTRHCVNSLSIRFVPQNEKLPPVLHEK